MLNLAKSVHPNNDIPNSTSRFAANAGAEKRHYLKGVKPGTSVCVFEGRFDYPNFIVNIARLQRFLKDLQVIR